MDGQPHTRNSRFGQNTHSSSWLLSSLSWRRSVLLEKVFLSGPLNFIPPALTLDNLLDSNPNFGPRQLPFVDLPSCSVNQGRPPCVRHTSLTPKPSPSLKPTDARNGRDFNLIYRPLSNFWGSNQPPKSAQPIPSSQPQVPSTPNRATVGQRLSFWQPL